MKNALAPFLIALWLGLPCVLSAQEKGKSYPITLTKIKGQRKGWQWTSDTVWLEGSHLHSKVMKVREKFIAAPCKIFADTIGPERQLKFAGTMVNRGISKIKWQGTIKGNKISGRAVWSNGQGVQTYTFTGTAD